MIELARSGWGAESPVFRQMFASIYIPDGSGEQTRWMGDLHRICTTPEIAARLQQAFGEIDVTDRLAQVKAPTLVLHCRGDAPVPFEEGRMVARGIPGARFVPLESRNHILLSHEPAFARLMQEVRAFLESPG
jgi:pimeloyl-ACP methyl ester carboxylesterase